MTDFDYVIVGAGSAGCALADRLSADGQTRVLVIEAGGDDRSFWIDTPIGYGKTFYDAAVNWKFYSEAEPSLHGRRVYVPRGKVVGGSSSINAMVYSRGMPSDYEDWRSAGNFGWGWDDVRAVYERFERRVYGDRAESGAGPLWVCERDRDYHPIGRFFFEAAREIGLPRAEDVNGPEPEGVGGYHMTTERGRRCSSARAFLRPALRRRNLSLRTRAHVQRVRFEGRRAVGVDFQVRGALQSVRARREVILCAGAIGSPALLQRSGVGPGALLARLGLPVIHANSAVGGGLQDHLGVSYFYRAALPTLNNILGNWFGRIEAGVRFLLSRAGPLSIGVNQFGGMVRSDPRRARPNVQLYFNPASYSVELAEKRELLRPDPFPGFIMGFNSCRPTSVGRVDIDGPDPAAAPKIRPNYLATQDDIDDVIAGARMIGRLQASEAMRPLIAAPPELDLNAMSDDAIIEDFRTRSGSVYHPCGTCRMAQEAQGGVVDRELKVYGVEGLRVVDASVFPNITSANINAPSIMVAQRAADLMAV